MMRIFLICCALLVGLSPTFGQSKRQLRAQIDSLQIHVERLNFKIEILQARTDKTQRSIDSLVRINHVLLKRIDNLSNSVNSKGSPSIRPYEAPAKAPASVSSSGSRSTSSTQPTSSSSTYNGRKIYTGPRGGRYYINSKGNKVYIKR